ncbi:DNA-binding response regulator [Neptunitalea chrysea]|uniref:DNA-binding response regulator n=1 Tax=Neptunitalea chrysea TaxID=1647581 RepID=A0A9W6B8L3_9FLAO|nr:response regulator transcription factor [Neptunitalea chrysea]GLB53775.1 DNA-binding response regulator [Neptunitalea chrysea]
MIRILIVDDHPLFAEGIKSIFNMEEDIEVVRHIINGKAVPDFLQHNEIDLILMDIDMPVIDGIETMRMLNQQGFDIPILMLTMHQSLRKVRAALEEGAQGYILKDASKAELLEAVRTTSARKNYFHRKINDHIFNYFRGKNSTSAKADQLSEREKQVVRCISEGLNTRSIAKELYISEHTVKTHRRNIMHKLKVKTSAELIKLAYEKGVI